MPWLSSGHDYAHSHGRESDGRDDVGASGIVKHEHTCDGEARGHHRGFVI